MRQATEKEKLKVLTICKIVLVLLVVYTIYFVYQISEYQKVDAQIIAVNTKVYESIGESRSSTAYFVTYEYTYNNTQYRVTQQVFTKIGKNNGDVASLYCNPQDPGQIANLSLIRACLAGIVFLGIKLFLLSHQNILRR